MASSPTRYRFDVQHGEFARCPTMKVGYATKARALDVAEAMMQRDEVWPGCHITPYQCEACHEWHVANRRIVFN